MARLIRRLRDELDLTVVWIEHAVTTLLRHVERAGSCCTRAARSPTARPPRWCAMPRWWRPTWATNGRGDGMKPAHAGRRPRRSKRNLAAGYGAFLVLRDLTLEARPASR